MKLKFIFLGKKGSLSFNSIINKYIKRLAARVKGDIKDDKKTETTNT